MRTLNLCAAVALVWHQAAASNALPPTTGPYHVGLQKHAVPYLNEADPVWPNNISTSFLVTVYYPTQQAPAPHDRERPYLDPATAALPSLHHHRLPRPDPRRKPSQLLLLILILLVHLKPTTHPLLRPRRRRPPSECYTALLSDLASHGYAVLALDHAHEQPFVRYPNGTGVYGLPILYPWTEAMALSVQAARVRDALALADYLPTLESKAKVRLNRTHIGIFGHSLGGSSAAATLLADQQQQHDSKNNESSSSSNLAPSFRAGMNIDGTFFGPLSDLHRPFLMLGQEGHGASSDPDAPNDATWPAFASLQKTAYWRWVNLKGTLHHDFSDIGYWKELVPGVRERDGRVGPIGGERLVGVWRAYARVFFDLVLLGRRGLEQQALLDEGVDAEWPEKMWVSGGGTLT
ncbi:lipase [Apiospora marii]|uniref:1-alkyl-2-acetylglycerophosphocholine esterase n=1 Tax=Apiospora marii TaxID=335849 RepID=A0ABR1SHC1_9PEZI